MITKIREINKNDSSVNFGAKIDNLNMYITCTRHAQQYDKNRIFLKIEMTKLSFSINGLLQSPSQHFLLPCLKTSLAIPSLTNPNL